MKTLFVAGCCALLFSTTPAVATSVYRCVDKAGKLTFTNQGCPANQTSEIQRARNPTPSSGKAVPLAQPSAQRKPYNDEANKPLTVVGEKDDGCGNRITGSFRRNAMIRQQIHPGMHRVDVESIFGTPDTVTNRNGQTQYRYSGDKGRTKTISFDEHGCVRGRS